MKIKELIIIFFTFILLLSESSTVSIYIKNILSLFWNFCVPSFSSCFVFNKMTSNAPLTSLYLNVRFFLIYKFVAQVCELAQSFVYLTLNFADPTWQDFPFWQCRSSYLWNCEGEACRFDSYGITWFKCTTPYFSWKCERICPSSCAHTNNCSTCKALVS